MDIYSIFGIVSSLSLVVSSVALGVWLLKQRRELNGELRQIRRHNFESAGQIEEGVRRLSFPRGARRTTSIHGVNSLGYLRHTDGSYTRGYHVQTPATLYADDGQVDHLYNDWARMLQSLKQQGCVVQVRHNVWADSGRSLHAHIKAQAHAKDTYIPARMLHTVGLVGTEAAAREGQYQDDRLTLWVRVPGRHVNDASRARLRLLAGFFLSLAKELRRLGLAGFTRAVAASWTRTNVEKLCVRFRGDEEIACEAASQIFASVEHMCPLELKAFARDEMWREVYLAHRLNERNAPTLPEVEGADLRQHLCGEGISGGDQFLRRSLRMPHRLRWG